jgi:putative sugar O-methyltransferase
MIKLKYLRHPVRTAKVAKDLFAARWSMWKFAGYGERRFKGDARFDLQHVTNGFQSRVDSSTDDTAMLRRICTAYIKATQQQRHAPKAYSATEWWQDVRQRSLAPVIQALLTQDVDSLRKIYRNFYRDACSTGLLSAPYGMTKEYFGGGMKDVHRRFYLSHVLCRFDYWTEQTNGRFTLHDLAGPGVGNPFGVVIDGTHISVGSEYAHSCAQQIKSLLSGETPVVAEIGGGFGGMAYYLLRDRPGVAYLDFDVPESIALASYYLMKSFPNLRFALYGEEAVGDAIVRADVVLMPVFELAKMPSRSVDVMFSSHAMSDMSQEAMAEYLKNIDVITRDCFFYMGKQRGSAAIEALISKKHESFKLTDTRTSGWHSHKVSGAGVGGAAGVADSTILKQRYTKSATNSNKP